MNLRDFNKWNVTLILGIVLGLPLIVFLFLLFGFKAEKFGETKVDVSIGKDKRFIISTSSPLAVSSQKVETLNPNDFYIDFKNGFYFKEPKNKKWSRQSINGIFAVRQVENIITNDEEFYKQTLNDNLALLPWGLMQKEVEVLRFVYGDPIDIEITDKSSNEFIERYINNYKDWLRKEYNNKQLKISNEVILDKKCELFGFERMRFSNEFVIAIFDKNKLKGFSLSKLGLFSIFVSSYGIYTNQLIANSDGESFFSNKELLLWGGLFNYTAKINGYFKDLQIYRGCLLAENSKAFILIEIGYSPQTGASIYTWDDLRALMSSFRVFNP